MVTDRDDVTDLGGALVDGTALTPALGFSAPNKDYPVSTHVPGAVAHLAFGLTVAAVTEAS